MTEAVRYGVIAEGMCPNCRTRLDQIDGVGWCSECGFGWSISPERVTLSLPRCKSISSDWA